MVDVKTSRVTRVTLVLWIGNKTLRKAKMLWECPWACRLPEALIESRQLIGEWRGCHHQHSNVISLYWRARHLLLRFLCRKYLTLTFNIYVFSRHFYQLLLSLGIKPMILELLAPCSTIWATGKLKRSLSAAWGAWQQTQRFITYSENKGYTSNSRRSLS